jgi:hypothetical protein
VKDVWQSRRAFEMDAEITDLIARPGNFKARVQMMYRTGADIWVAGSDGSGRKILKLAPGTTGQALWAPSGRTLTYLHFPDDPKDLITLREQAPEDGSDQLLAKTSQFISATPNADGSVFAAASRSVASPYVLIMLRVARRELTLCEHRASDPRMVNPVFTPDSKTVAFVSDRHGKPAIYLVPLGHFVEETGGEPEHTQ